MSHWMTPALQLSARAASALLAALVGLNLTGCASLWGASKTETSLAEYRQYMAERAAAENAETEEEDEHSGEV